MQKRRLFLAVNLPEDAKRKVGQTTQPYRNLPVRWTAPRNLHLTLVFIGYVTDEEMLEIANVSRDVTARHHPFSFDMTQLILAPPKTTKRMVWWEGTSSEKLENLFRDLQNSLAEADLLPKIETRPYHPHITVGRIRMNEWRSLTEKPEIEEPLHATIPVGSVKLMESELKRGGAEYSVLESFSLE